VSMGLDVNLVDKNGFSPLHVAVKKEQTNAIEFALKHNKTAGKEDNWFDFDIKGKQGYTPLHLSIMRNNSQAFKAMIDARTVNFF